MSKSLIFKATVEGVSGRKDKTVKLTIGTQELKDGEGGALMDLNQSFVNVHLKLGEITDAEIADLSPPDALDVQTTKSHSQRFRAVLYRLWEQNNEGFKESADHYQFKMEGLIEHYKEKLD